MKIIGNSQGRIKAEAAELLAHPQILVALNSKTYERLRSVAEKSSDFTGADYHTVNAARERIAMVGGRA